MSTLYEDILRFLPKSLAQLGLQPSVTIVKVDHERVFIEYEQDPAFQDFAQNMIRLERVLRQQTGQEIDLRLEPITDRNKRDLKR